ncbi:hypothetical protein GPA22_20490 [Aromatoleum toluvorans]|uniref:Uncharacterized protein n=1 Tax=Aromatoleum toluvorans TaxID=92002 RepID=A0ABX1Q5C5_9RHOO|nr:hypothetical protein [Aromatoleum toluvorans]NMG46102.1 hypothetical protein [Aromatoleum toluvorans]
MVILSAFMFAAVPAAMADTVTLSGGGVTIRYEDRAAELTGAPSLIATGMMTSPASVAGAQFDAPSAAAGLPHVAGAATAAVSAVGREAASRSFADGVGVRFSLGGTAAGDRGFDSLLLAGLALFVLIVRQRVSALPRLRISPLFQ